MRDDRTRLTRVRPGSRHARAHARPITRVLAIVAVLGLAGGLGACTREQDGGRDKVSYDDVEMDAITAPAASARGAREFLQGGEGAADGEPLRIAWLNANADWDVSLRAGVELVNRELDGVAGRPVEIVACRTDEDIETCASRLRDLDPLLAIIGETGTGHAALRRALGSTPAVGVEPEDPQAWNDPLTHYFSLGTTGTIRAAARWSTRRSADEKPDAVLVLAPHQETLEGTLADLGTTATETLVIPPDRQHDAERTIAAALDSLGERPEQTTLIVNALGQDGCISLARTVDPRTASPSWGRIDVVTTGTCAGRTVHDELGDWPPGWYHVGSGPDLQSYELDPQVRVYRDRITRYGKPDADWTAANSLPFAALMTALRIVTPLQETATTSDDETNQAIAEYTGPGYMGMPSHRCGFDPRRTSLCVDRARIFLYTGQRDWRNLVGEPFTIAN